MAKDKNTKEKLVDIALQLFYKKGYENTSVDEIVKIADMSKGAFYHHFKSKEEVLEAAVEDHARQAVKLGVEILESEKLNAIEKFNQYFSAIKNYKASNVKRLIEIDHILNQQGNLKFKDKYIKKFYEFAHQPIVQIIKQGIGEKIFKVSSPEDAAMMIFTVSTSLKDNIMELFLGINKHPENIKKIKQKINFMEEVISRILGMEDGKIKLFDGSIDKMVKAYQK